MQRYYNSNYCYYCCSFFLFFFLLLNCYLAEIAQSRLFVTSGRHVNRRGNNKNKCLNKTGTIQQLRKVKFYFLIEYKYIILYYTGNNGVTRRPSFCRPRACDGINRGFGRATSPVSGWW